MDAYSMLTCKELLLMVYCFTQTQEKIIYCCLTWFERSEKFFFYLFFVLFFKKLFYCKLP